MLFQEKNVFQTDFQIYSHRVDHINLITSLGTQKEGKLPVDNSLCYFIHL